ncbi:MAG: hypothetical protein AB7T17_01915 [Geobacter sp.]
MPTATITFTAQNNHQFTTSDVVDVFTADDLTNITTGDQITDTDGNRFTIADRVQVRRSPPMHRLTLVRT